MSTVTTVLVLVVAIGGSAHAIDLSPQQKKDAVTAAWSSDELPSAGR
jgi:hypothetical protein